MSTDQEYWDACLIKTWRNDGTVFDAIVMFKSITGRNVLLREEPLLRTPAPGFPFKVRMRPFVAQHLEKISKRLWEQTPDKDVLLLKKLKDSKYTASRMATNTDSDLLNARNQLIVNRKRVGLNALQFSVRNQSTDWRVTK
jgi:hypothetical protein